MTGGKLAMLGLGGGDIGTEKLRPVAGQPDLFRIERANDEGLGEEISFQRGADGAVVSKTRHGQINRKLSDAGPRPIVPLLKPSAPAGKPGGADGGGRTTITVTQPDGTQTVVRPAGGGHAARL